MELLLALERDLGPRDAGELVADLLAAELLSEKVRIWAGVEARLAMGRPQGSPLQPLRNLAGQVVWIRGRAVDQALELCRVMEPGFGYFDAPAAGCRWLLAPAVPSALSAMVCGAPAVDGSSWCPEHSRRVFLPKDQMGRHFRHPVTVPNGTPEVRSRVGDALSSCPGSRDFVNRANSL